jgi:hypothetical protein
VIPPQALPGRNNRKQGRNMATQFKISTADGEVTVKVKPKHILKSERAGNTEATAESTYRLAWMASESDLTFDEWIDSVDEIDPIIDDVEAVEVPPTTSGSRGSRSARA